MPPWADAPYSPEDDPRGHPLRRDLVGRVWAYVRPYRTQAVAIVALTLLHTVLVTLGPVVFGLGVGCLAAAAGGEAGPDPARTLTGWALAFLAIEVVAFACRAGQEYLTRYMGQYAMLDLRRQAYARLQRLPLAFFDRTPVGVTVTRVTNDVAAMSEFFATGLVMFGDLLQIAAVAVAVLWIHAELGLWVLAMAVPMAVAVGWFRVRFREAYREVRRRLAAINGFVQEAVDGVRVIKVFNQEPATDERFFAVNLAHLEASERSVRLHGLFSPFVTGLTALGEVAVLCVGGWAVLDGRADIAELVTFLFLIKRLFGPVRELAEKYNIVQAGMAAAERVFRLMDEPPEPAGGGRAPAPQGHGMSIEFRDVSFAYRPDEWVLQDLDLTVGAGERVALVGVTGAGKTTIISLVARFYLPTRGQVLVDGLDTAEWDLWALRRRLGFILQEPYLFPGTVLENVRLGDASVSEERVGEALRLVQAEALVERLPQGLHTEVGERGGLLSSGERQLIAFARVLAFDPSVLILDEATSHIDPETDRLLNRAVDRVLQGRTALVIAHRLETVRKVDRILVLHKGHLREQGSWDQLLAADGMFRRLHTLQFGPAERAG